MTPQITGVPRPSATLVALLTVALLVVGYGDGIAAGVQLRFNLPSPWIVEFALLLTFLAGYLVLSRRGIAGMDLFETKLVIWCSCLGLALQLLFYGSINAAGYIQLCLFVFALILVRALFARAPDRLLAALGPAVLLAHVYLAGYVLTSGVVWTVAGVDLSVKALLSGAPVAINDYYGYRPAAWGAEPAWTAMALAVSCTATYYLMPRARIFALVLTALAAVALQSGTLFLFLALVACGLLARHGARGAILVGLLVVVAVPLVAIGSNRVEAVLEGRDPSVMMRSSSAFVALDVVVRSFPFGVGYGNFRDNAIYGAEFDHFLPLDTASYYKSDLLILNLASELGFGGVLIIAYVFRVLGFGRLLLPTIFLSMLAVVSGTMLVPALLVLAAVTGSQDHVERHRPSHEVPGTNPDGVRPNVPYGFDGQLGSAPRNALMLDDMSGQLAMTNIDPARLAGSAGRSGENNSVWERQPSRTYSRRPSNDTFPVR